MLRSTLTVRAPVYLMICDGSRAETLSELCRRGVGFSIKVDLGFAVASMPVPQFQKLIDDHFKKCSPNYHSVTMGHVYDQYNRKVNTVYAHERYIVAGMMKNGYIKQDPKYNGFRLNGQTGNYKGGLQWGGDRW